MSPTVQISDETFEILQLLAEPFVDTPETVISGLARAELKRMAAEERMSGGRQTPRKTTLHLEPDEEIDLAHTRIISASINGDELPKPNWNAILIHLHVLAKRALGSFDGVRRISRANLHDGRYEQSGFKFVPQLGFSIQGVGADKAWSESLRLAQTIKVPIHVEFEWRNKKEASYPGQAGVLEWMPDTPSEVS